MKAKGMLRLLCLAGLWMGHASAQVASGEAAGPAASCPLLPEGVAETLRWEAMRTNNILFCRAIVADRASSIARR